MALRVELVAATAVAFPFKGNGLGVCVRTWIFFSGRRNGFFLEKICAVVMVVADMNPRLPYLGNRGDGACSTEYKSHHQTTEDLLHILTLSLLMVETENECALVTFFWTADLIF